MSRYAPGYKGPMTTAGPSVPRRQPTIPALVGGPTPFLDSTVSPRRPPVNPTPVFGASVPAQPRPINPAQIAQIRNATAKTLPLGDTFKGKKPPGSGMAGIAKLFGLKKGGAVKKMASKGKVSSASKRADGCVQRGKTKGRMV